MPRYIVEVNVSGTESFFVEADTEEKAREIAEAKVDKGDWQNEVTPDLLYQVGDIELDGG